MLVDSSAVEDVHESVLFLLVDIIRVDVQSAKASGHRFDAHAALPEIFNETESGENLLHSWLESVLRNTAKVHRHCIEVILERVELEFWDGKAELVVQSLKLFS